MLNTDKFLNLQIIEDRQISHRASEQGPRVGRQQVILNKATGERTTVNWWYQWETGKLLFVR